MKKLIAISGVLAITLLASCKDNKEEREMPATPPPVEDPAPPARPAPTTNTTVTTTTTTTEEDPNGTSVNVNPDGVSVRNKDGDKENNVTISRDKKELQIQTN